MEPLKGSHHARVEGTARSVGALGSTSVSTALVIRWGRVLALVDLLVVEGARPLRSMSIPES